MNEFHHRLSSSPSIKPSTISKDTDENEPIYQQTSPSLQNITKPMPKNYMSSTISAASKANAPRKILGNRNEATEPCSFETKFEKISILDHSDESLSQSNGGGEEDAHEVDLPSQPYDPLTNYLSPRPQFLRYKPNRRHCRVIYRGEENEDGEAKEEGLVSGSGSFDSLKASHEEAASDSGGSSSSSSPSSITQEKEDEDVNEANDEIEESDEDEIEEEEEDKGCNFKGLLKSFFLLAFLVLSIMFISSMNSSTPMCSLRFDENTLGGYCNMQNHTFSQKGGLEVKSNVFDGGLEEENMVEAIWLKKHESSVDFMYQGEEIQMNVDVNEEIEEESFEEIESTDELKEDDDDAVEVAEGENKSKIEDVGQVVEPQIEDEFFQDLLETAEDYQAPIFSEEPNEVTSVEEIHDEEVSRDEDETELNDENLKQMETKFSLEVLVAGLILSTIIAALFLRFRLRAKPCSEPLQVKEEEIITDDSEPLPSKPYFESWKIEKCTEGLPSTRDEHIDEVVSLGKYSQSHAPSVEFLGEFVIREIRNSGVKNRKTEVEESNFSVSTENLDDKSHSVSIQPQPAHSEFSVMDDSPSQGSYAGKKNDDGVDGESNNVMMTPTPAKRSSRKGEAKVVTATPVRRSSRIRTRAVVSP
ncbi:uncharacterized protein LOC133794372 [Humulus lupulus]|uniref:uncharacterized protein LOC133794372 n=1 Tax=Humulus lupulus TaxID=3486 RepID=UPI002B40F1DD|nr:uncharacterized protein LOC133794372 [Humulus lupulus]